MRSSVLVVLYPPSARKTVDMYVNVISSITYSNEACFYALILGILYIKILINRSLISTFPKYNKIFLVEPCMSSSEL